MTRERSGWVRFLDFVSAHPTIDLGIALVVTGGHLVLRHEGWVSASLRNVAPGQRALVYGAVATVAALAAGSNNTAVGSYVSSNGAVVDGLRRSHGAQLRTALRSVGAWLWMVALAALSCFLIDPGDSSHPTSTHGAAVVFELAVLILVLKFARLTLIQDLILRANDLSVAQEPKPKRIVRRRREETATSQHET